MKIKNFKKIKNEQYEVIFDNGENLKLFENVIINNKLLNREINEDLYLKILKENELCNLEYIAIKYIERKLRSKKEMSDYLFLKSENIEDVNFVIDRLEKLNLINDNIFAKSYAKDKYNINKYGRYKIINALKEHYIDDLIINDSLSFIDQDDEVNRIKKLVNKYLLSNKKDSTIKIKNKIINSLSDKGYPKDLIYEVLSEVDFNDDAVLEKHYKKIYKKYSNKYDDEQLKKIITNELLKKGFTYEQIKRLEINF